MVDVWNKEIETLSKDEAEALRMKNLKKQLAYVYENSDFYKEKFKDVGATPDDITTWKDFRSLPVFMDKETERAGRDESLERFGHPYGMHICVPPEEILVVKTTGGTTGLPTFTYSFTKNDMARWNEGTARLFHLAGLRKGDRVLFCFPLSGCWAGSIVKSPLFQMNIATVEIGAETETSRIIEFANMTRPNVLMATPSFAETFAHEYQEATGHAVKGLGIRKLFLTGEPGVGIPAVKRHMEDLYGGRWNEVFMANSEAFVGSCNQQEYRGLHEVAPDLTIWAADLVDPETRQPIPVEEGAIGEGVLTSLKREGLPLIKYAQGDIIQIESGPCSCDYPGSGYRVRILGRFSDRLVIDEKSIYPVTIRNVVVSYIPMVTGAMRIVLKSAPPVIEPPLLLKVEHGPGVGKDSLESLSGKIRKDILDRFGIPSAIEFVPPGSLGRVTKKTPIFEERY
jgi:phenylacetate-CoA ligase